MYLCFDTETTGLPVYDERRNYYHPRRTEKYDSSRIVSISWILANEDLDVVESQTHLIKPDGYVIPESSTKIHGITQEMAESQGKDISIVIKILEELVPLVNTIVAHNLPFDLNILRSECFRYGREELAETLYHVERYCTMERGKKLLSLRKNPKLAELYQELYDKDITNAHDAEFDTYHCFECFKVLKHIPQNQMASTKKTFFSPTKRRRLDYNDTIKRRVHFLLDEEGTRTITLNSEQEVVVYAPLDTPRASLVLAVAGSGKTTTIVCRLKHLVDSGIPEEEIILTTFTRDATQDMRQRLESIFGYEPDIKVGTMDSIARGYITNIQKNMKDTMMDVSEYGPAFLNFLKKNQDVAKDISKHTQYMVIDEFQDIDEVQYGIIKQFYKHGTKIICVGDDAQNIYTFRGSDVKYILNFGDYFEDNRIYQLSTNYRSTPDIVAFANASIENNEFQLPKTMTSYMKSDESSKKPQVVFFDAITRENMFIKDRILELGQTTPYENIAVLSCQNSFLYELEGLLTKYDVPHVLLDKGGDVKAKLKSGHVCLSTIHKSKGLEWDHVFLMMCNDQIFPARKEPSNIIESRRLFYVAITRPRKTLYITYSALKECSYISRFVSEVDVSFYAPYNMRSYCYGLSSKNITLKEDTLSYWIDKLNGSFLTRLKEDVLPDMNEIMCYKENLYDNFHELPEFVKEGGIQKDFDTFLKTLVYRQMAEQCNSKDFNDEHAQLALGAIKLSPSEKYVYNKYRNNFSQNLKKVSAFRDDIYGSMNKIMMVLSEKVQHQRVKPIEGSDRSIIIHIIHKLNTHSKKVGLDIDKLPVFNECFLPSDFESTVALSLSNHKNLKKGWRSVVWDTWQVSKCYHIVMEKRRRLLYKKITRGDLNQGDMLYEDMFGHLAPVLASLGEPIIFNEKVHADVLPSVQKGVMHSTVDMRCGDVILTILPYSNNMSRSCDLNTIMKMLLEKEMYALQHDIFIKNIGVIDIVRGSLTLWDVNNYQRGATFVRAINDFLASTDD
jgi:DNA polymerase III epsilon subunit-like protein